MFKCTKVIRIGQLTVRHSNRLINGQLSRSLASAAQVQETATGTGDPNAAKSRAPNMSFMANLFRGNIVTDQVFPYPDVLNEDQREFITMSVDSTEKFYSEMNDPAKNDETASVDVSVSDHLWEMGMFGIQAATEYGGLGMNNTQYARMAELAGSQDLGLGIVLGAHQSIGFKGISLFGTKKQKEKYLPMVTTGKTYAAFCLTEPSSGSDAGSIRCRAVKSADGSHYVLNGSKIWISNGGIANVMTVFAQTEVDDPKTGSKKDKVTAFIVERQFGGVTNGPPESKMGIKCSNTAEVYYEDCKIPVENVLGGEGNGFKVAMHILNNGRFGMAATLSGTMMTCIAKATDHANNRVQFGRKISSFGAIQEKLARMSIYHYVTQTMGYMVAGNMDSGCTDYQLEAAISKVFASEAAWYVCDEAIQTCGGMGYMKHLGLERIMRDLRIFRIFEGTNDILRLFVALTGIQYAGSHLKELQRAFNNPTANLGLIFKEGSKRAARSVGFGTTDLGPHVHPLLQSPAKQCSESVDMFGDSVEKLLRKHGKSIVEQQFLLNRLADAAIDIYAMSVVLSRSSRALKLNLPTAAHEQSMVHAWCTEASDRVRINLGKIDSSTFNDMYNNYRQIAENVCVANGVAQKNPINV